MLEDRRDARLQSQAAALYADLGVGRWELTRAAYGFYASEARRRAETPERDEQRLAAVALAEGVGALWEEWQRVQHGEGMPAGRRCLRFDDRPVLLVWRSSAERMAALAASALRLHFEHLDTAERLGGLMAEFQQEAELGGPQESPGARAATSRWRASPDGEAFLPCHSRWRRKHAEGPVGGR